MFRAVLPVLLLQTACAAVLAIGFGLIDSMAAGWSAGLAAGAIALSNWVMAWLAFHPRRRPSPVWLIVGHLVKILIAICFLMSIVLMFDAIIWRAFLSGLFVSLLIVVFSPLVIGRAEKKQEARRISALVDQLNNNK